jgi:hypothetical protein
LQKLKLAAAWNDLKYPEGVPTSGYDQIANTLLPAKIKQRLKGSVGDPCNYGTATSIPQ